MAAEVAAVAHALRAPRVSAVAGILFALLFGVAVVLVRQAVPADPDEAGAWLTDATRRGSAHLGLSLIPFAGICFLWFMGAVRDVIGARDDRFFDTLFLGSGFLFVGILFLLGAMAAGLLSLASAYEGRPPVAVWQYGRPVVYSLVITYAMRMAGMFAIATSMVGLRLGLFPRWLAVTGLVVGVLSIVASGPVPWVEVSFPLWVLVVNVYALVVSVERSPG